MKIVSVMTTASRGGAEFAAVEMLDAMVDRGHEAVMISNQPLIGRETGVRVRPIDIGPKLAVSTWPSLLLRAPVLLRRMRAALEAEWPYDVLMLHYKKEQLLADRLPDRLHAILVWAEWGPVPFPLRRGVPRRLYLKAAKRVKLVMAVSAGARDSVCEVGVPRERVEIVPNVMRAEELRFTEEGRARVRDALGIPEEAFTVGCISRFHPKKRNDVVIDAVKLLGGEGRSGPHLILAGDGETEPDLRALAAPLGDRAHFVPTPGADVAEVLSAFDVSVFCPSPTEGAPRAVILGMLAGRPCLSTGAEGVRELIVGGMGAITDPENSPDALALALRRYMDAPELVRREGAHALERALATYDGPVVARDIEAMLGRVGASIAAGFDPGAPAPGAHPL